ncbi:hypothetical protein [Lysobacter gummosus]|uniref:hypothetical protein n=1 Tax=Lysobacter gummosus TaxID=262324 RepID=UPI003637E757
MVENPAMIAAQRERIDGRGARDRRAGSRFRVSNMKQNISVALFWRMSRYRQAGFADVRITPSDHR